MWRLGFEAYWCQATFLTPSGEFWSLQIATMLGINQAWQLVRLAVAHSGVSNHKVFWNAECVQLCHFLDWNSFCKFCDNMGEKNMYCSWLLLHCLQEASNRSVNEGWQSYYPYTSLANRRYTKSCSALLVYEHCRDYNIVFKCLSIERKIGEYETRGSDAVSYLLWFSLADVYSWRVCQAPSLTEFSIGMWK